MKVAIEGCAHGELEKIYDTIEILEKLENIKVDLLICCGDFQSTRNLDDLQTMAVPKKFQDMCTFYKYYSGEKVAPILTVFVGGNHEASNYLQELPYGGWVAPNIYYLGLANVININGIRIAGISGIYKGRDFQRGHYEFSPYTEETKRSVYHVRQLEVFRLKQLSNNIDIFISHDWPRGVYHYGNHNQLIRFKPFFKEEIESDRLGSPACADILQVLQPTYWFAAHLHCKFAAFIPHENSDKITKFLALDKCLPKRRFLQIIDIHNTEYPNDMGELKLEYDLEWLTILNLTNHLINTKSSPGNLPDPNGTHRFEFTPTAEEKANILKIMNNELQIPRNFCRTVEAFNPNEIVSSNPQQPKSQINPQTTQFCDILCIDDPLCLAMVSNGHELSHSSIFENSDINYSSLIGGDSEDQQTTCNSSIDCSPLKRKSMSLKLPEPKENHNINPDELNYMNSDDNDDAKNIKETVIDENFTEIKESTEELADDKNKTPPPMKKFKRRNQSLYASKPIDEEDNSE